MKTPNLPQQRRHNLQASARGKEARDMKRGPDLRSYSFIGGPSSRAQTNCQIRSTSQKGFSNCQEFRISSKISCPPHRYYSRAWLRQKGSTSHLGTTFGLCGSTNLTKLVSFGRRNRSRIDEFHVFHDFVNLNTFRRNLVPSRAPATEKPQSSRLA